MGTAMFPDQQQEDFRYSGAQSNKANVAETLTVLAVSLLDWIKQGGKMRLALAREANSAVIWGSS